MPLIFVHRYRWSHDSLRRRARKLLKLGQIRLKQQNSDGWLYAGPADSIRQLKENNHVPNPRIVRITRNR